MFDRQQPKGVDDAGRPIRGIDLDDLREHVDPKLLKNLTAALAKDGAASHRGQLISATISIALIGGWWVLTRQTSTPAMVTWPTFLLIIVTMAFVSRGVSKTAGRYLQKGGLARTAAANGYCGGCGYDLQRSDADEDGLVRCSECGALWSSARLGSARVGSSETDAANRWDPLGKGKGRVTSGVRLSYDDRGALIRRIVSVPRSMPKVGRHRWTPEHRAALGRVRRSSGRWWRFGLMVLPALFVYVSVMIFLEELVENGMRSAISLSWLPIAIAGALFLAIWFGDVGVRSSTFVRRVRDTGICSACATPLDLDERDEEGYCVCQVCGSSWKPDPISQTREADRAASG